MAEKTAENTAENGEREAAVSEEDAVQAVNMKNKANEFFKCEKHVRLTLTVPLSYQCGTSLW